MPLVVGFDPGLSAAGLALVDSTSLRCLRAWTVRTSPAQLLPTRLARIEEQLKLALDGAELLAIEDQHQTYQALLHMGRSNAAAGRLERVVGIAHGIASARGVEVVMLSPQAVRMRLGVGGRAKKDQIGRAIRIQLAGVQPGISNHATDAAAIALAGAREWHGKKAMASCPA